MRKLLITTLFSLFLHVTLLCGAEASPIIGLGIGIHTYPAAFDPEHTLTRVPVLYAHLEMSTYVRGRLCVSTMLARSVIKGTLAQVPDSQSLEFYTAGCGFDYNLSAMERPLKVGLQVMTGFGHYDAGRIMHTDAGLGLKIYMSAQQPVSEQFSWGIRSGLLRLTVRGLPFDGTLQCNSFFVEMAGYFGR